MKYFFVLIFTIFQLHCFSQKTRDNIIAREIVNYNCNYKDFVVSGKWLYGLTKGDSLIIWDTKREKAEKVITGITSITTGKKTGVLCSTAKGDIMEVSANNTWRKITEAPLEAKAYKIVIDNKGNPALLTNKGVFYKDSMYAPPLGTPFYRKMGRVAESKNVIRPDVVFLDREQRIWMGYDAGEWGGDTCFFDIVSKEFYCGEALYIKYMNEHIPENDTLSYLGQLEKYKPNFSELKKEYPNDIKITANDTLIRLQYEADFSHIKGITQDNFGNFYVSSSLMHFLVDGNITVLKGDGIFYSSQRLKTIFKHKISRLSSNSKQHVDVEEYLGPVSFNKFNKSVYYYTNEGFFKIIEKDGIYSKKFIFRPYIIWTAGLPDAVGYQMNVTKFEFIAKDKFFFLTGSNGIGYYTGKEVIYFR